MLSLALAAVFDGSGLGWTAWCRDWTYFCTFLLLFLFLSPNVLSSTIFCFLASSAFDGCAFFGGILSGCFSHSRALGIGRRKVGGGDGRVSWVWGWRKGKAEARRKFLEMQVIDLLLMWVAGIG